MAYLVLFAALALGLAGGAYFLWRKRMDPLIADSADRAWAKFQRKDPHLLEGMDRARFDEIFASVEYPRMPGYLLAILATMIVATPIILLVLTGVFSLFEGYGIAPEIADAAAELVFTDQGATVASRSPDTARYYVQDLAGFGYFFGALFGWLAIVAFYMRRYHQRTPGTVRDELIRAK